MATKPLRGAKQICNTALSHLHNIEQRCSYIHTAFSPPPPRKNNSKSTEFDRSNTYYCSDKGIGCTHCRKTQAVPVELCIGHQVHPQRIRRNERGGNTAISVRRRPSPAPHHKKALVFMDNHKRNCQIPWPQKAVHVVLTRGLFSQGGWGIVQISAQEGAIAVCNGDQVPYKMTPHTPR